MFRRQLYPLGHLFICLLRIPFVSYCVCGEQCDQKKIANVYKSGPKMISLAKLKILTPLQKLPKNVGNSGKLIVAKVFKTLPKVQ